jgi:hypothetical protein
MMLNEQMPITLGKGITLISCTLKDLIRFS